ncbi:MAG: hypothetical protein ACKOEE_14010 [Tagaea sp.]
MLTWIDCLSLADLTADEVRAIAEHERISEMAAVELGAWLCQDENGVRHVKTMIREDLAAAVARGDVLRAATLKLALRHFCDTHPDNPARGKPAH